MTTHRYKLAERIQINTGHADLDLEGTITELVSHPEPDWACSFCDNDCPGPWYQIDSVDPTHGRVVDTWAEHDLRRIPTQGATP